MDPSIKFPECNNVAVKKLSAGTVQTTNLTDCQGKPLTLFSVETINKRIDLPFGSVIRFLSDLPNLDFELTPGSANLLFTDSGSAPPSVNNFPLSVGLTTSLTITTGVTIIVPFDGVLAGESSQLLGTGEMVAPEDGTYQINASITLLINGITAPGDAVPYILLLVNGNIATAGTVGLGVTHQDHHTIDVTGGAQIVDNVQAMFDLKAGDKVGLFYTFDGGIAATGPLSLQGILTPGSSIYYTVMNMHRV